MQRITNDRQVHLRPRPITQSTNHNLALVVKPKGEIWPYRFPGIEVLRSFKFSELRGNRKEKITREPTDWLGNPGTSHGSWYFFSLQQAAAYKHILVFILQYRTHCNTYVVTTGE